MSDIVPMRDLRQWVCWRAEERNAKSTKVPYSPVTGSRAASNDPTTWATLAQAREAAQKDRYEGIGFVFTESDPFCGADLDSCIHPETGEVEPWAKDIVGGLDSYTEISPSGTGLHIIVRAEVPPGGNRKGSIELYDCGRFFTVTGNHLHGTPSVVQERQRQIQSLHARLFPLNPPEAPPTNGTTPVSEYSMDDAEVLRRAMSASNGSRFAALWAGDASGYSSDSEAGLALCSMLAFWTGPDEERIASLFARSGLARKKWDREDYRRSTITRALSGAQFYKRRKNEVPPSRNGDYQGTEIGPQPAILSGAAPFPVEAMPAPCRPLIREATAALGCAPELVALPMLATLSSAIGTSRVVEV